MKGLLVAIGVDVVDPLLKPSFTFEKRFDAISLLVIVLSSRFFDQLFQVRVLATPGVVHDAPVHMRMVPAHQDIPYSDFASRKRHDGLSGAGGAHPSFRWHAHVYGHATRSAIGTEALLPGPIRVLCGSGRREERGGPGNKG